MFYINYKIDFIKICSCIINSLFESSFHETVPFRGIAPFHLNGKLPYFMDQFIYSTPILGFLLYI